MRGDDEMADFYLVCGISGGGKTILSKRIIEDNPSIDIMLDVDKYYAKINNGDECNRNNTYTVWRTVFDDLHRFEAENKNVLITTNSLTVSQRRQFIEWFPKYKHHMLWVIAPLDRCLEGNRTRKRHIPEDILKDQWSRMEFPNAKEEGWDTIAHITNWWEEHYTILDMKGDIRSLITIKERS